MKATLTISSRGTLKLPEFDAAEEDFAGVLRRR
jgi:hypothetical protein